MLASLLPNFQNICGATFYDVAYVPDLAFNLLSLMTAHNKQGPHGVLAFCIGYRSRYHATTYQVYCCFVPTVVPYIAPLARDELRIDRLLPSMFVYARSCKHN